MKTGSQFLIFKGYGWFVDRYAIKMCMQSHSSVVNGPHKNSVKLPQSKHWQELPLTHTDSHPPIKLLSALSNPCSMII